MSNPQWHFNLTEEQAIFKIDLDKEFLRDREPTADNWLLVMAEAMVYVIEERLVPNTPWDV